MKLKAYHIEQRKALCRIEFRDQIDVGRSGSSAPRQRSMETQVNNSGGLEFRRSSRSFARTESRSIPALSHSGGELGNGKDLGRYGGILRAAVRRRPEVMGFPIAISD
jgi:hypothetical protein